MTFLGMNSSLTKLFLHASLFTCHLTTASMVSSSSGRLPMSLSTVISDLEAEGVSSLSTATVISTKSVSKEERSSLFSSLFSMDDRDSLALEESSSDMEATAFGKKFGEDDVEDALGIVVANPSAIGGGCGAAEVASTVLATHGTVIFVVSKVDLSRKEGIFDSLAPAMERMLLKNSNSNEDNVSVGSSELIVIFQGVDETDLDSAKEELSAQAQIMLSNIVGSQSKTQLEHVFDTVEYLTSDAATAQSSNTNLLNTLVNGQGQILEPGDAAASVSSAVALGLIDPRPKWITDLTLTKYDIQALQKINTASNKCMADAKNTMASCIEESSFLPNFGQLCEATINNLRNILTEKSGDALLKQSPIARRKIIDITEELIQELSILHQDQLTLLQMACFDSFKQSLSKLKISPALPDDMEEALVNSFKDFTSRVTSLYPKGPNSISNFFTPAAIAKSQYHLQLKEYNFEKLQSARASGAFKPVPRKGVTLGFHWLLPKPFGNDYRLNPTDIYRGDMVYSPTDKVTEVPKESVSGRGQMGDWRDGVVPIPNAGDIMYTPGN